MATLDDDKLKVLEASDIAQVIGEYVKLVPKGREFTCLCPFHDDKQPLDVCRAPQADVPLLRLRGGGDVFTFIQKYHGVEFGEALKMLAERAGIELTRRRPSERVARRAPRARN
jgi:DNA primase